MTTHEDSERVEYAALASRVREAERLSQYGWLSSGLAAAALIAWGVIGRSAALMLPAILAVAWGFQVATRAREEAGLIAAYLEEFHEGPGSGLQWFSQRSRLPSSAGRGAGDWAAVALANLSVGLAVAFAWVFSSVTSRGELMAGLATGCGLAFAFYSVSETARELRSDRGALWRQTRQGLQEVGRPARVSSLR
ncbi:MAG TPA: hypothetical protein VGK93_12230 [Candidatus Eisenbacteria bacterium]|jgi:hypothetical protein